MGTIVPKSGSYLARWYVADAERPSGKRRVSKSFPTRTEAERHLAFVSSGFDVAVLHAPLGDALRSWIDARHIMGQINAKTAERDQNVADNFALALGNTTVLQCTLDALVRTFGKFRTGRHRKMKDGSPVAGLAPRTLKLHRRVLRQFFREQVASGRIQVDPSHGLASARLPIVDALEPSGAQVEALVAAAQQSRAANGNLLVLITLLEITGLRRGEALALTRDDFNRMDSTVWVGKSLSQTKRYGLCIKLPKSAKGQRRIEVPSWYFDLLDAHYSRLDAQAREIGNAYRDSRLVFPDAFGGYLKPDSISGQVGALKTAAGWPEGVAGMHGLRHKFGSTLVHSGVVGLKDVAHAMGHADEAFTLRVYVTRRDDAPPTAHLFKQPRGRLPPAS